MTTLVFKVENDKGNMVDKTETLMWVKNYIKESYYNKTGKNIGSFTVKLRKNKNSQEVNEIVVTNESGQSLLWHYGGFDGFEVIEPDHFKWSQEEEAVAS